VPAERRLFKGSNRRCRPKPDLLGVRFAAEKPFCSLTRLQANLIASLNTRVVVPLLPLDAAPTPAERLNPIFEIQATKVVMATQFMAAVPQSELATLIASLDRESNAIFSAIDFLHRGW